MLHGGFGSAAQAERAYGWDELADPAKFVVAYPDGLQPGLELNGGDCCGPPAREDVDDIGFITAAVADIGTMSASTPRMCLPPASATAASCPTRWRATPAFSPRSARIGDPAGPLPDAASDVGDAYPRHRRSAHPLWRWAGLQRHQRPIGADVNAFWRNVISAAPQLPPPTVRSPRRPPRCADDRSVVLVTVDGGGHQWPSFATAELWEFFAAHPH